MNEKMDELKKLAVPLQEWLASNYDPMCCIVVQADRIKILRAECSFPSNEDSLSYGSSDRPISKKEFEWEKANLPKCANSK
jgi:hypothetical protein